MSEANLTKAAADVLAERRRQVEAEGWTPEHDDSHETGELARAAACYTLATVGFSPFGSVISAVWPRTWSPSWLKLGLARRMLVKACALILAEIERLDRARALAQGEKT